MHRHEELWGCLSDVCVIRGFWDFWGRVGGESNEERTGFTDQVRWEVI